MTSHNLVVIGFHQLPFILPSSSSSASTAAAATVGGTTSSTIIDPFHAAAHLLTIAIPCDQALIAVPAAVAKTICKESAAGSNSSNNNINNIGLGGATAAHIAEQLLDILIISRQGSNNHHIVPTHGIVTMNSEVYPWMKQTGFTQISAILLIKGKDILGVAAICSRRSDAIAVHAPFLAKTHSILQQVSSQQSEIISLHLERIRREEDRQAGE